MKIRVVCGVSNHWITSLITCANAESLLNLMKKNLFVKIVLVMDVEVSNFLLNFCFVLNYKQMIVNRTLEYKRLNPHSRPKSFIDVSKIRKSIDEIYKNIKLLNIKQDKLKLPSFESKKKKRLEIQKMNDLIKERFKELEKMISEICTTDTNLNKFIINYFNTKLKTVLLDYKQVQQSFLNISCQEISRDVLDEECQMNATLELDNIMEIKKNIYEITNFILEMKMLIHQGSVSIDRLDVIYESSNINIEKVNNELEILKNNYKGVKDKLMYFMGGLVLILTILAIIKIESRK
jgi:hypothetical protein